MALRHAIQQGAQAAAPLLPRIDNERLSLYAKLMIRSFRDDEAKQLFNDEFSRNYRAIERIAQRKLTALDEAETPQDLAALPGNRLEALKGDRRGQHSIRINDRFRLCFVWADGFATGVEIVDYH